VEGYSWAKGCWDFQWPRWTIKSNADDTVFDGAYLVETLSRSKVMEKVDVDVIKELLAANSEIVKLRRLILENTRIKSDGKFYWPNWVDKYFESLSPLPGEE